MIEEIILLKYIIQIKFRFYFCLSLYQQQIGIHHCLHIKIQNSELQDCKNHVLTSAGSLHPILYLYANIPLWSHCFPLISLNTLWALFHCIINPVWNVLSFLLPNLVRYYYHHVLKEETGSRRLSFLTYLNRNSLQGR